MTTSDGRLDVGIIGAGNVGPVIGRALAGAGHTISGVSAVSERNKERAEALLPGVPLRDPDEIVRTCQLVIFAIPGSELPTLIQGLTDTGAWQPGQLALHTAPEHGYSVFAPALSHGVIPMALHPAMLFSGTSLDLSRLQDATAAVNAPGPVLPIVQALAVEMGAEPFTVPEEHRAEYADTVAALGELTGSLVRQSVRTLTDLGLEYVTRTAASIARAAVDEALFDAQEDDLQ